MRALVAAVILLPACSVPVPEAYQPVPVRVAELRAPRTPEQAPHLDLLYAPPSRPHVEMARLHARGQPGMHVSYVIGELREEAARLGADALVVTQTLEGVRPPMDAAVATGRPATVAGGVIYEVEATAIEFLAP